MLSVKHRKQHGETCQSQPPEDQYNLGELLQAYIKLERLSNDHLSSIVKKQGDPQECDRHTPSLPESRKNILQKKDILLWGRHWHAAATGEKLKMGKHIPLPQLEKPAAASK